MKLYYSDTSPYSRMVILVARLLSIELELEKVNPHVEPAELVAKNPLSKIPVLVLNDGEKIVDSELICKYLNENFAGDLFPVHLERRQRLGAMAVSLFANALDGSYKVDDPHSPIRSAEQIMTISKSAIDAAVIIALEKKRPTESKSAEVIAKQTRKISGVLNNIQSDIDNMSKYDLKMPEITLISLLGYLDLRIEEFGWRDKFPAISDWMDQAVLTHPFISDSDHVRLTM